MKNKKLILAAAALIAAAAILMGVYMHTRPDPEVGYKDIHIVVVYEDGTVNSELYWTDAQYLSELLLEEGRVTGYESAEYGFTIESVDGIAPDWAEDGAYWALYVGEEYATTSAAGIVLEQGGIYKLVYTIG